jgi:hypothetical protein
MRYLLFAVSILLAGCGESKKDFRLRIDLSGEWEFALDSARKGVIEKWYLGNLEDSITLPGTTDLRGKGYVNTDTTTTHLNRMLRYEGPAWYRKKIVIPAEWNNKRIALHLERTKPSQVWVDDHYVGNSFLLESEQRYDLTSTLSSGEHSITILVDNDLKLTPYGNVHIYSDDTQTNWNGIIGSMYLEASDKTWIEDVQVYPDIDSARARVVLSLGNQLNIDSVDIALYVTKILEGKSVELEPAFFRRACNSWVELAYDMHGEVNLWDEYRQPLYRLNAVITAKGINDNLITTFGMREFKAAGTQFQINDRTLFLRGKQDACVFPLTGFPPTGKEEWRKLFSIAKSYGINHYRFHSWCPPRAAFEAADEIGMFLQPELPFWGGLNNDMLESRLKDEGVALLKNFGNHPSFVMFSAGNEIWSGHDRARRIISQLKAGDPRRVYTQGSNNGIGYVPASTEMDYHIAARTPSQGDTVLTHTRLTHAFADSREGGLLNAYPPSTRVNFDHAVSSVPMPLVSHEIGQYQIYPDFDEMNKYTGILKPWNLHVFRKRLDNAGMLDQNKLFQKASGAWAAICYRAEMEAAFRTKDFAGFQLLDLQDFPGQGTALVGILDAFMDSKNVIPREQWLQSCNDVVVLAQFDKYTWQQGDTFRADVSVANYSDKVLRGNLTWRVSDDKNYFSREGSLIPGEFPRGGLHNAGKIEIPFSGIAMATKLQLTISIEGTVYQNVYPIWVYPSAIDVTTKRVLETTTLDENLLTKLEQGASILYFPSPSQVSRNSVKGLFPPEFWNYGMFKSISESVKKPVSPGTLSLLMDPTHSLFSIFPTDPHTNWQWWSIIRASNPLILDETPHNYRPIVQVIDNVERNHKFGMIFEFAYGKGKLLVCMARLNEMSQYPEAKQLHAALIRYMQSGSFSPASAADKSLLQKLSLVK